VHFRQFMKDDMATAERVLAFAGHPVSGEARAAIRKFMDANPRGKHGTIDYRLEDVGLDYAERRAALRFYRDHFDVAEGAAGATGAPAAASRRRAKIERVGGSKAALRS